ncbi:puromycin N-acetyltransferase [Aspergillus udagawae]|uniref:Puromycin N-acetyltransferase n=1 Tax=Aspergillus udagawae TaxID=91492 RepID=A0ABQ1BF66_9EURO|nr:puromycin N-acetyltransferase [Aspergillus udagawae]GFG00755.1 puromycin N-acetyltransferase [Aspergillus udagawae]
MATLTSWTEKVEQAADEIMGRTPCYRLSFIATDPSYARRGAGSLLVNWGIERSKKGNLPIALESTLDAVPFYKRLGFQAEARISMSLEGGAIGKDGETVLYEEECFVYRPKTEAIDSKKHRTKYINWHPASYSFKSQLSKSSLPLPSPYHCGQGMPSWVRCMRLKGIPDNWIALSRASWWIPERDLVQIPFSRFCLSSS